MTKATLSNCNQESTTPRIEKGTLVETPQKNIGIAIEKTADPITQDHWKVMILVPESTWSYGDVLNFMPASSLTPLDPDECMTIHNED